MSEDESWTKVVGHQPLTRVKLQEVSVSVVTDWEEEKASERQEQCTWYDRIR